MCIPITNCTYGCGHTEVDMSAGDGARENPFCLVPGFCNDLGFVRSISREEPDRDCSLCYARRLDRQHQGKIPTAASAEKAQRASAIREAVGSRRRRAEALRAKSDTLMQLEAAPSPSVLQRLNELAMSRLVAVAPGMSGADVEVLLRVAISLPLVDKIALVERFAAGFVRHFDDESTRNVGHRAESRVCVRAGLRERRGERHVCLSLPTPGGLEGR